MGFAGHSLGCKEEEPMEEGRKGLCQKVNAHSPSRWEKKAILDINENYCNIVINRLRKNLHEQTTTP